MACGLLDAQLFLLNRLTIHRNFKPETAENYELLKDTHNKKRYAEDFDDIIQKLKQRGLIAQTPKKAGLKIYLPASKRETVKIYLRSHNFPVWANGFYHL